MKRSIFLLLFLLQFSISQAQLKIIEYKLDNGFTVILNPDSNANQTTGAVAVNTGSKNDPADATGISHYLEHLLFKGTKSLGTANYEAEKPHLDSIKLLYDKIAQTNSEEKRKTLQTKINEHAVEAAQYAMPNEFDKLLKSIGSTGVNATTNSDLTIYFNQFPVEQIEKWLDIYAHRFQDPVFRSFQSELEVVYEEKNRAMDDMQRRVQEEFIANFYTGHPYGENNTLGKVEHLKNPSLTKMYEYFDKYYVANNMALILCGNFNVEAVKPMIAEKFGKLKAGGKITRSYPAIPKFDGRVVEKVRMTPIKAGIMGFHTVPVFHEDYAALEICSEILQNQSGTGLIDELKNNNDLMMAFSYSNFMNEAGNQVFVFVPKILFQSLKKAENLILEKIELLKQGDFSNELMQTAKYNLYKDQLYQLEDLLSRGYFLSNYFTNGRSLSKMRADAEKYNQISKEEVVRVAQKYFGDDYFVLQSRTGFPKKEKLNKPGYKAVKANQDRSSEYAKKFAKIPSLAANPRFIDFKNDIDISEFGKANKVLAVKNPINSLYELKLRFHGGEFENPLYLFFEELINYTSPAGESLSEFKSELSIHGSNIYCTSTNSYFEVELNGIEENLEADFKALARLVNTPDFNESGIKTTKNTFKTDRKTEKEEPVIFARALAMYGLYGKKSPLLRRASFDELNDLEQEKLNLLWQELSSSAVSIHFSGQASANKIKQLAIDQLKLNLEAESPLPRKIPIVERKENEIVVIDNGKILQSHFFITKKGKAFNPDQLANINLFNLYFDDGFSGILTQEVREYRSLAYVSSADFTYTAHPNTTNYFYSYVGCQADKTNEAVELCYNLINDMPKKEERMPEVINKAKLKASAEFPDFRERSSVYEIYQLKGLEQDPNQTSFEAYDEANFESMYSTYEAHIKNSNTFIGICGDFDKISLEKLRSLGKVREVKIEEVISF